VIPLDRDGKYQNPASTGGSIPALAILLRLIQNSRTRILACIGSVDIVDAQRHSGEYACCTPNANRG
jgi:hypothetical protein